MFAWSRRLRDGAIVLAVLALASSSFAAPDQDGWDRASVAELADRARQARADEDGETFDALARYAGRRYLAERENGIPDWGPWVELLWALHGRSATLTRGQFLRGEGRTWTLSGRLGADAQTRMQKDLTAYVGSGPAIGRRSASSVVRLWGAQHALGRKEAGAAMLVAWLRSSDEVSALRPGDRVRVAHGLRAAGDEGDGGRDRLLRLIEEVYLPHPARMRAIGCRDLSLLSGMLSRSMTGERRAAWAAAVKKAFVPSEASIAKLTGSRVHFLALTLRTLHDPLRSELIRQWADSGGSWTDYPESGLALAGVMLRDTGREGTPARVGLYRHLLDRLSAEAAGPDRVGVIGWETLAVVLGKHLTASEQRHWADRLAARYGDRKGGLSALGAKAAVRFTHALDRLDRRRAGDVARRWLTDASNVDDLSIRHLGTMVQRAARSDRDWAASFWESKDEQLQVLHGRGRLTWRDCVAASRTWRTVGDGRRCRQWARNAYTVGFGSEEARASADSKTLVETARLFVQIGIPRQRQGHLGFAAVLGHLAERGELSVPGVWPRNFCASMVPGQRCRGILLEALTDGEGAPRLELAKVIGWTYRMADETEAWIGLVERRLETAGGSPDHRALWLLARAHAKTLESASEVPEAVRGLSDVKRALAEPAGASIRLVAIAEAVDYYERMGRRTQARSLLDSLAHQFTGESAARMDELRSGLERRANQHSRRATVASVRRSRAARQAKLGYLRRRLALARRRGDRETESKLRAAIRQAESGG